MVVNDGALRNARVRRWQLEGVYNLRDIGGYPTRDGRSTRWGVLWRSDSLHRLSAEARRTLLQAGIKTVIDLRVERELAEAPSVFADAKDVAYVHISLLAPPPTRRKRGPTKRTYLSLRDAYRDLVDTRQAAVAAVLKRLAEPGALPAVVHCTAGKDRTGIIVALLLSLVGVADEVVAADYAATEANLAGAFMQEFRERTEARGIDWERYLPVMASRPEEMFDLLSYLEERYGGAEAYMLQSGLGRPQLEALRTALVD